MAADDEGSSPFHRDEEDLAKRYEALSDDKKQIFDRHHEVRTNYGQLELPPHYGEVLLTTLEKDMPDRAQDGEISYLNGKFDANPNWRESELHQREIEHAKAERRAQERDIPDTPHRPGEMPHQELDALLGPRDASDDKKHGSLDSATRQEPHQAQEQTVSKAPELPEAANVTDHSQRVLPGGQTQDQNAMQSPQPSLNNSLEGKLPSGPPRDYSELERMREQVAAQSKQAGAQPAGAQPPVPSAEPAVAMLSKDQLIAMIEHFPDIRREANILTTRSEINERAELARTQDADRIKLDQAHGPQPDGQQQDERNLLDHQHLAEQAGVQAKWIALHLKAQNSPDAAQYGQDARRAFQTARLTQEQRQNFRAGSDRAQDTARGAEDAHNQQQANAQEAARSGGVLTSEQRTKLSPEARQMLERKERTAARETTGNAKHQTPNQGNPGPGKSPSGGRSR